MSRKKGRGFRARGVKRRLSIEEVSVHSREPRRIPCHRSGSSTMKRNGLTSTRSSGRGGRTRTGWLRGYPKVEVRGVPDFLAESAAALIQRVCNYMLEQAVCIKPGETMATSPRTRFRLIKAEPFPGAEDHYLLNDCRS